MVTDGTLGGQVALVTGAGRNLGREIALELARHGARIGVNVSSNATEGKDTVRAVRELGGQAILLIADVGDPDQIPAMVRQVVEEFGHIDILINNAAIRPFRPMREITVEEWDRVIAVNLRGPFLLAQAVAPIMARRKYGRIVNVSGVDAYWGTPNRAHVVSTKAGILGLTRALAGELVEYAITVNAVVPGVFNTTRAETSVPEFTERRANRLNRVLMRRPGEPSELAKVVRFLASPESSYMTGQEVQVNGGGWPQCRASSAEHATFRLAAQEA
ncbi:MAG TPA: 3-oxoacyl-ACP reductase family protein [Anaerolineales bacterium]|nr:3-oxoacyl-ACP reductase family protein [Anaerolineales bacterium]